VEAWDDIIPSRGYLNIFTFYLDESKTGYYDYYLRVTSIDGVEYWTEMKTYIARCGP